jgi:hypothetical protein
MAGATYNIKNNKVGGIIAGNASANNITQPRPFGDDVQNLNGSSQNNGLSLPVIGGGNPYPDNGMTLIFESSGNDMVFAPYPIPSNTPNGSVQVKQLITWKFNQFDNKWVAEFSQLNPQKFVTIDYVLTADDDGYSIIVTNGTTAGTITIPEGLPTGFQVGILQDGTGDITIVADPAATLPIAINNSIGGYKIKGQYDSVFIEQGQTPQTYYLLGNTKV